MMLRRYHEEKTDQKQGVTTFKDVKPEVKEEAPKKATRKKAIDKG